jgi:hypothetical protein
MNNTHYAVLRGQAVCSFTCCILLQCIAYAEHTLFYDCIRSCGCALLLVSASLESASHGFSRMPLAIDGSVDTSALSYSIYSCGWQHANVCIRLTVLATRVLLQCDAK